MKTIQREPVRETATGLSAPIVNALTVDVEDYFQVSGFDRCVERSEWDYLESRVVANTHRVLDLLRNAEVRATFFVLGWVAERYPQLVRAIRRDEHEVGSHGYGHRLVYEQTPRQFRGDLRLARDVLQDVLGEAVTAYRAPSFSITRDSLWALDVLIEEGFTFDSSIYPTRHDRYGLPGAPPEPHCIQRWVGEIWEFPPPIWRCCGYPLPIGGGGYFRLYPYALTRHGLQAINAAKRPFAAYVHPWELDPEQPRFRPGWLRAFRHYVNLNKTAGRLEQLLRDFHFAPLSESLARWHEYGNEAVQEAA
jgi:polysaccharide deacetylase family protein (PEP-CTERM system associated)